MTEHSTTQARRKRVLHIMSALRPSGMEMMFISSAEEWSRYGYQCDILGTEDEIGPLASKMREAGYGVHHIPFRGKSRYILHPRFVTEFYRLCSSDYDIVHVHTETITPLVALLARLAGVSQVAVTPHGAYRFSGFLRVRKYIERWVVRLLGGRYGMISEGVRECEWQRYHNPGVRTQNWLDTSRFRPPTPDERLAARRSCGCVEDQFIVVSVGNCSEIKNHAAILRAIHLLKPSLCLHYVHVGREELHYPERALCAELEIGDRVQFLGSQDDPLPYLWAADAFVMPSLFEGFGISAIEAIAASTPAVLAKVEGLSDIISATQWTVATSNDPQSLAAALEKLALTPVAERRRRASIDSITIRERFSMQEGVRSIIEELYLDKHSVPSLLEQHGGQL